MKRAVTPAGDPALPHSADYWIRGGVGFRRFTAGPDDWLLLPRWFALLILLLLADVVRFSSRFRGACFFNPAPLNNFREAWGTGFLQTDSHLRTLPHPRWP